MSGPEPRHLYDMVGDSALTYQQFRQAREFSNSIKLSVDAGFREVIATNEQLSERGIAVIQREMSDSRDAIVGAISDLEVPLWSIDSGIREVRDEIALGFDEVNRTLRWGFGELIIGQNRLNDTLQDLLACARTPSQIWALEQFEIARDDIRRGLVPEALQTVTRAIEGFGSQTGYKTEFRFHLLRGAIHLGGCQDDPDIIDLAAAEESFLLAARYASSDLPGEAADAFIHAGRAAFLRGRPNEALVHTQCGLKLVPNHAQGLFQAARLHATLGAKDAASEALANAFVLCPMISLLAGATAELSASSTGTDAASRARPRLEERVDALLGQFDLSYGLLIAFKADASPAMLVPSELENLKALRHKIEHYRRTGTLAGYSSAISLLHMSSGQFFRAFQAYRNKLAEWYRESANEISTERSRLRDERDRLSRGNEDESQHARATESMIDKALPFLGVGLMVFCVGKWLTSDMAAMKQADRIQMGTGFPTLISKTFESIVIFLVGIALLYLISYLTRKYYGDSASRRQREFSASFAQMEGRLRKLDEAIDTAGKGERAALNMSRPRQLGQLVEAACFVDASKPPTTILAP
jgi:tetratricopeptide (TPR) repeat protein